MYVCPNKVPVLTKGKLIDTVDGFVAFWNWMVHWIWNLKTGPGLKIDEAVDDAPVLKLNLSDMVLPGSGIKVDENNDGSVTLSTVYA